MNELQYQDVSTYLRAWYKGKKNDSPIELGSDLGYLRAWYKGKKNDSPIELGSDLG
jgi:hypothetical protein